MDNQQQKGKEPSWIEVDSVALSENLAEKDWERTTKGIPQGEVYEHTGQVRPSYASLFWNLYDEYKLLVEQFRRPDKKEKDGE